MQISFEHNIREVEALLTDAQRRALPMVTAKALNQTAFEGRADLQDEMRRVFDRPRPFTIKSTYVSKATTRRLEAAVYFKDGGRGTPAGKYLQAQVFGGDRDHKRFEVALVHRGVMRADQFAVPAPGAKLDKYGMIPGGTIMAILSSLGAQTEIGFQQNQTATSAKRRRATYFSVPGSDMVMERRGKTVKPILLFVSYVDYERRLDMEGLLESTAAREFPGYFAEAFEDAFQLNGAVPF